MVHMKAYFVHCRMIQVSFDYFNGFLKSNLKIVFLKNIIFIALHIVGMVDRRKERGGMILYKMIGTSCVL